MRLSGLILLLSGWLLAVAALCLLPAMGQRLGFLGAALLLELLGLAVVAYRYRGLQKGPQ